ncbi:hypothetical protein ACFQT0_13400 [Hymenobacter humi]|uniref:Uncharacterized protein n=1 Tax=Hymenobacter humi TaxID=1411620 RepID=A0ABW2U844_9BACT
MLVFLLLGFVAGAALVGALAWRRHRRTQRQLAQVAQALAALNPASLVRCRPAPSIRRK